MGFIVFGIRIALFILMRQKIVVVGNGMVGYKFCERFLEKDTESKYQLVTFCEEPRPAYDRVHLSEYFSDKSAEDLYMNSLSWYEDNGIELYVGEKVVQIDRKNKRVISSAGKAVSYDKLVLATGSSPFVPPVPGIDKDGVFVYRTIEDLDEIMAYAKGVYPVNDADLVDRLIEALGFDAEVDVGGKFFRDVLLEDYEIRNIALPVVKAWAERSGSDDLVALVEAEDRGGLNDYLWGREIIDLVMEHPIGFESVEDFLGLLKPLAARLYSIASSPKAHPDEVHLTVGVVEYESNGMVRKGVCSTYFSERTGVAKPRVFVHENRAFRPPVDPSVPMIMVGPGTGIAPFRAFLEEREALGAEGKNWLFFGNPYEKLDFLYQEELEGMKERGYLHELSLAFSRDQEEKVYVQDRMIEEGEALYACLLEGGHFYVCGDASRMAKDVDAALHRVIEQYGGMSADEAVAYVNEMKSAKRYCRDVY